MIFDCGLFKRMKITTNTLYDDYIYHPQKSKAKNCLFVFLACISEKGIIKDCVYCTETIGRIKNVLRTT